MRFKREVRGRGRKGDGEGRRGKKMEQVPVSKMSGTFSVMDDLERENGGRETGDGGVVTKERERIDEKGIN